MAHYYPAHYCRRRSSGYRGEDRYRWSYRLCSFILRVARWQDHQRNRLLARAVRGSGVAGTGGGKDGAIEESPHMAAFNYSANIDFLSSFPARPRQFNSRGTMFNAHVSSLRPRATAAHSSPPWNI